MSSYFCNFFSIKNKSNKIFDFYKIRNIINDEYSINAKSERHYEKPINHKTNIKIIINLFKYIIVLNLIYLIQPLYNISLTTIELKASASYPILNTRFIGKPMAIYFEELTEENYNYQYINDYLYIKTNTNTSIIITLVWNESIGEVEIIPTSEIYYTDEYTTDRTDILLTDKNIVFTNDTISQTTNKATIIIKSKTDLSYNKKSIDEISTDEYNDKYSIIKTTNIDDLYEISTTANPEKKMSNLLKISKESHNLFLLKET